MTLIPKREEKWLLNGSNGYRTFMGHMGHGSSDCARNAPITPKTALEKKAYFTVTQTGHKLDKRDNGRKHAQTRHKADKPDKRDIAPAKWKWATKGPIGPGTMKREEVIRG